MLFLIDHRLRDWPRREQPRYLDRGLLKNIRKAGRFLSFGNSDTTPFRSTGVTQIEKILKVQFCTFRKVSMAQRSDKD